MLTNQPPNSYSAARDGPGVDRRLDPDLQTPTRATFGAFDAIL